MQRILATFAITLSLVSLAACSKDKPGAVHDQQPASAPLYSISYKATCADAQPADECVASPDGFTIISAASGVTYVAGPNAAGEKREGSVPADQLVKFEQAAGPMLGAGVAALSGEATKLSTGETFESATISVAFGGGKSHDAVVTSGHDISFHGDVEQARALRSAIRDLARQYYFNTCTDALQTAVRAQDAAQGCEVDADCSYFNLYSITVGGVSKPGYEELKRPDTIYNYCYAVPQMIAGKKGLSDEARWDIREALGNAAAACQYMERGAQKNSFYATREGCKLQSFTPTDATAPVCVAKKCSVNPAAAWN